MERNEGTERRNGAKEQGQENSHKIFEVSGYMEQEEEDVVDSVDR
jgi:hypothetical protein